MSDPIVSFLDEYLPDYLAHLERLVNIDCGTHNKAGVDAVGAMVRDMLEARAWSVRAHPQPRYGDFLEARFAGHGQVRIMLLGHLDTVYPDGTAAERPLRFENDRALGPGVSDMKSGLLTGIFAVDALLATGFRDFAEIIFFINSEEEVGSPASTPIYTEIARDIDVALVLESARANGDIVSARKGGGKLDIRVTGREAHAGVEPEKGVNAIVELAHQIQAITALNGMTPGTTVNVCFAKGGTRTNVVPASAEASVDVRVVELAAIAPLEDAVAALAQDTVVPGTTVEISGGISKPPMEKTPAIAFLVELAQQAAHELGFEVQDTLTGGTSDANPLAAIGVPVLDGLGPVGGHGHSPEEYIDVTSIVPRTAMLASLLRLMAQHQGLKRKT
ncbi:MAG: M20 family metallopeptidase [Anaerolineae bacterium]